MKKIVALMMIAVMAMGALTAQTLNRYELNVEDFTELKVIDGINVEYRCNADSAGKAVFVTNSDLASVMMLTNKKNKLEIQISTDGINYSGLPTVYVYSSFLTSVENCGDSTVRVLSLASGPTLNTRLIGNGRLIVKNINTNLLKSSIVTGNGQIVLYGKALEAKYTITGTGSIQADELRAQDVKCRITGTGTIGCNVSGDLVARGFGSGKVYYSGTPNLVKAQGVKALELNKEE